MYNGNEYEKAKVIKIGYVKCTENWKHKMAYKDLNTTLTQNTKCIKEIKMGIRTTKVVF